MFLDIPAMTHISFFNRMENPAASPSLLLTMTTYDSKIALLKERLEAAVEGWEENDGWDGLEETKEHSDRIVENELEKERSSVHEQNAFEFEEKTPKICSTTDGVTGEEDDQEVVDQEDDEEDWIDEDEDEEMDENGDDETDEEENDEIDETEVEHRREKRRPTLKQALLDAQNNLIELVRQVETENPDDLSRVVDRVDELLNYSSLWANDDDRYGPYRGSSMPSFAHNEERSPLLQETLNDDGQHANRGIIAKMLPFFRKMYQQFPEHSRDPDEFVHTMMGPRPWRKVIRLHPSSTLCSRFKEPVPEWQGTDQNEDATHVFHARCEVTSGYINLPSDLTLSISGNVLCYGASGGWKSRTPYISYFLPAEGRRHTYDFLEKYTIKLDLWDCMRSSWIDEERNLFFVGDWDRVKSYRYRPFNAPKGTKRNFPVHTMNSKKYSGPLALLGDGRLVRAGKGSVAVWQLDKLQTHGESGKDLIGEQVPADDMPTWRDDPEDIEPSTGSDISTTFQLEGYNSFDQKEEGPEIHVWRKHPSQEGVMLCGMDNKTSNNFCHAYDLQAGGKIAARYLGHGGTVEEFSTVPSADPNLFLTRCTDGHARLYDVRHPLPVVTIVGAIDQLEVMTGAALAMPSGHPFVFTSTATSEDIKLWDIRSRALVYELATGNNTVDGLAWDQFTSSLYAATSCLHSNIDNSYFPSHRPARFPKQRSETNGGIDDDNQDEEEEHPHRRWPTGAFHAEDYWGHIFDCGGQHRMFQYTFKSDPDAGVLPFYG